MKITIHTELIEIINGATGELHLHLERPCGTQSVSFRITDEDDAALAEGVMDIEVDEYACYIAELAWAILDDCYDSFATVTEYDSLTAGTNPQVLRA
jgi:catabolite regulation protein CreA